ncbi:MAG: 4Fe-4S binding protein, partial [Thermotogota bacterium]
RPLIISLGYQKEEICSLIKRVEKYATAFELSTHYVGTDLKPIAQTVKAASEATEKPVFIKLSPHITDPAEFAQMVKDNGGYGIVAINSVGPTYPINLTKGKSPLGSKDGYGWISGPVIKPISLSRIKMITQSVDIPVIGVGGIKSAEDVLEFLAAGASAVQMLSAAMLYGKDLYSRILNDLPKVMEKYGFSDLGSVKGLVKGTSREINLETGYPVIDHNTCTLCSLCVRNCPYYALSIEDKRVVLDESKCFRCGLCESRCPVNAIEGVL